MPPSNWRAPQALVTVNGNAVAGAASIRVISNNQLGADRFAVEIALGADTWADAAYWAGTAPLTVAVQASMDGGLSYIGLIQGDADQLDYDTVTGTVRLNGRDFSARLIGSQTTETYSNRTSSEIVTILAQKHGLAADVTATSTPVGRYYQGSHDSVALTQFSRATSEWDLLSFLAQQEGFDIYVSGTVLYFHPPGTSATPALTVTPGAAEQMRLRRELALAGPVTVTVQSWNTQQQSMVTATVVASPEGEGSAASGPGYSVIRPNLSLSQAQGLAQKRASDITQHELSVTISLPGETALTARDTLSISGTGTVFDQSYAIEEIDRRLDTRHGFHATIRAKASLRRSVSMQ